MKVELTLQIEDVDREEVGFTLLSKELEYEIVWSKTDEYPTGPNYKLEIVTDVSMKNVKRISCGDKICISSKDLTARFLNALFELDIVRQIDEADGIEHTHEENEEIINKEEKPYDPKLIRVDTKPFPITYVETLITSGDLDLSPDFQREFVWTDITRQSRLIESLMLRIPLPVFYLSQDTEGSFKVVDGVQRLSVIHDFLNNRFKLKNLEYLTELDGKWYKNKNKPTEDSIPQLYFRRIEQTHLYFNIIDPQAPEKVKYDIFKRINTGGKTLNAQEIRNCLSSKTTRKLLSDMVKLDSFQSATRGSISSTRMADKEIALRFATFYLLDNNVAERKEYRGGMNAFLDETNDLLNRLAKIQRQVVIDVFDKAMQNAYILFGDRAFRKANYINKSLFLSLSRILYHYDPQYLQDLNLHNIIAIRLDQEIINNLEYNKALSMATNDARNVVITHNVAKKLLEELIT